MHTLYLCGVVRARRHGTPRESVLIYDHVKVILTAALCVSHSGNARRFTPWNEVASRWTAGEKITLRVLVVCMFMCISCVCFSVR